MKNKIFIIVFFTVIGFARIACFEGVGGIKLSGGKQSTRDAALFRRR